ncbi:uroporphyrinogen-III synthase [Niallia sp. FSL W8-0635]|uniref:uroporphyrinogen-III synthase n=1 Tax=Niallia sp. FSL W8-0635 TaxID=2975337 RepID=UPI002B0143AA|nr:uroporphyrinogen-III synthase [Yersinia enterocolitica]
MANLLLGKKILVPRSKKQASVLSKKISDLGGIPIEVPLIAFREKQLLDEVIESLKQQAFDWLVFTSYNGVAAFFEELKRLDIVLTAKIAVIGEKTKTTVSYYGYQADFIPSEYVAEQFVEEFVSNLEKGQQILLVKGNRSREYLAEELKEAGFQVKEAVLYETYFPNESEELLVEELNKNDLDVLLFTSSSTAHHFMQIINKYHLVDKLGDCMVFSIGPITTETLENYGLHVTLTAKPYTTESILNHLVQYLTNEHGGKKHG